MALEKKERPTEPSRSARVVMYKRERERENPEHGRSPVGMRWSKDPGMRKWSVSEEIAAVP